MNRTRKEILRSKLTASKAELQNKKRSQGMSVKLEKQRNKDNISNMNIALAEKYATLKNAVKLQEIRATQSKNRSYVYLNCIIGY